MAVYKIPQDVEAEDKLLGPFSFRQFIYLIIAILSGGLAYFLGTVFIGLALIPVPLVIVFLILALPLKKDQPMEVYAAAILAFYLKPRRKLWEQDGILTMVEFTNDGPIDKEFSPDITFAEASQRISYLSNLVDSSGQIIKTNQIANPSLQADISAEATQVEDVHDDDAFINQKFNQMINRQNQERREQIIENLHTQQSNTLAAQVINFNQTKAQQNPVADPQNFQLPVEPVSPPTYQQTQHPEPNSQATSPTAYDFNPSPDIINLANNNDLSIQTLAAEAKKISDYNKKLLGEEEEVVISLR